MVICIIYYLKGRKKRKIFCSRGKRETHINYPGPLILSEKLNPVHFFISVLILISLSFLFIGRGYGTVTLADAPADTASLNVLMVQEGWAKVHLPPSLQGKETSKVTKYFFSTILWL